MSVLEIKTFISFETGGSVTKYAVCWGRQILSWHETESEAKAALARLVK